ncbi:Hypothetical predicted protein [Olea europaea subsp. europaea]|uniref:Uncharacterized protein n=1 Tax=Olea europaea subsp. europaea TaxID=158383 RepID=A0A8S0PT18_OLEEU|nr:Hypothetical predicted protein [Olea europaea subsp. europaea]
MKTPHNNALHRADLHTVSVADGGDPVSVVDGGDIVSVIEGAPTVIGDPNHSCEATVSVDMSSSGVAVNCFHGAIVVDVFAGVREIENIEREGGERQQIGCAASWRFCCREDEACCGSSGGLEFLEVKSRSGESLLELIPEDVEVALGVLECSRATSRSSILRSVARTNLSQLSYAKTISDFEFQLKRKIRKLVRKLLK